MKSGPSEHNRTTNTINRGYLDKRRDTKRMEQWIIVKLPKKDDIKEYKNWRGVTLLTTANKILAYIIINQRRKQKIGNTLRQKQAAFRRGRSCIDQIATMRIIMEDTIERNANLILVFVDFEKAFDRINHGTMCGKY